VGLEPLPDATKQPYTLTPMVKLEQPINPTFIFWMVAGSQSTWREPTHTRGEHVNATQKGQDSNQDPFCCDNHRTAVPQIPTGIPI